MGMTPKSGVFLMGSCVAAIAAVGSVFELGYGHPTYGTSTTAAILIASIPISALLFWAAVRDTKANQ
ncbi:hypothetical protein [Oscillatoria sp. FACHB-1406]|uniref:hypothetical protein n=1 Tax=Oscillatoria sp. FACHB-1406 TaxID=2692846 RepID=UPI0016840A82|nr:hypothetical protein [Oscillatoria sp. FACHB-1406]MBD2579853.1 hypothetical protein [Oscillatoria sp. FACHB-1406]